MKSTGQLFYRMSPNLGLSDVFKDQFEIMHFLQEHHGSVCLSRCIVPAMLDCLLTGDLIFAHLVTVVSARLLYYKVTVFSLLLKNTL